MAQGAEGPRQFLLRAVAQYDPATGLDGVIDRVSWSGASPRAIAQLVLGRLPRRAEEAPLGPDFDPRAHARALLASDAFRRRAVRLVLEAFPAKRRLLHVHVPKAAGTHLRSRLSRLHALLSPDLGEPGLHDETTFFTRLRDAIARVRAAEAIVVSGHVPLRRYLGFADDAPADEPGAEPPWWRSDPPVARHGDALFAVLREPDAAAISHANYVTSRLLDDQEQRRPDTRGWLRALEMDALPPDSPPERLREVARAALHSPAVTEPDRLCRMLGRVTAESVFETLALCDIELSHVDRYVRWAESRFGIKAGKPANVSRPILTADVLTAADRDRVMALTEQDRIVHDRVRRALALRDGTLSVSGPEVAALPPAAGWLIG